MRVKKNRENISKVLACIAFLIISGCTQDQPVKSTAPVSQVMPGIQTMKILPENPAAVTDLRAEIAYMGPGHPKYRWAVNDRVIDGETSPVLLASKKLYSKGDRISAMVAVDDKSASASVDIRNALPMVTSVTFKPNVIYRGIDITAEPVGFDGDGDFVRFDYTWLINGEDLSNDSALLSGSRFKQGDRVSLKVIPYDNESKGEPFITRPILIPNGPPRFVSIPPTNFRGETYTYQAVAEDPDKDTFAYSLVSAPQGMTISALTGLITMQIKKEHVGTHVIEIAAQDPQGLKATQKFSLNLTIP